MSAVRLSDAELSEVLRKAWKEIDLRDSEAYHIKNPCLFADTSYARRNIHLAAQKLKLEIGSRL